MKLKISELTTERKWRAATGYTEEQFKKLSALFLEWYRDHYQQSMSERHAGLEVKPAFDSEEELLFFTLFSLKCGLSYDLMGLVTGMDGSNAKRNQELGVSILKAGLSATGHAPKRSFKDVAEFSEYLKSETTLILDATEQRTQRPGDPEDQQSNYSGKKKPIRSKKW
ncbi:MAG: hypothetical protein EAZ89_15475 [Bacteroidetes bacterium]|jgi:hypothetical protein|nr:MAG: hypothetical protein EAZ89_15475 [Bacteroidota bacterium]